MQDPEFELFAQRYIDGQTTAAELEHLNDRLRSDPETRQWFIELLNLDSALAAACAGGIAETDIEGVTIPVVSDSRRPTKVRLASQRTSRTRWIMVATACLAVLCGSAWWLQSHQAGFATVSDRTGVEELAEGAVLRGDWHEIKAGTLGLVTQRGVHVVIESPATFRFESAQRLHLTRGRVAADVPKVARGFTVVTPTGQAVDLGTKFGVDVPPEGKSEIHVFMGEVVAQSSGGGKHQSLREGEAYRLQSGAGSVRDLRSAAFIRPDEVASLHAALKAGQRGHSDGAIAELKRDPALIALFDFESDEPSDGTFRMVQGRWPGSRALEFFEVGDHLKLDVGGDREWPELTLASWVRLDRLGAPYQSLLHTDGWGDNSGQVHWMVTRHSTMRLALYGNTLAANSAEKEGFPDSRTFFLSEQGRWVHLAVVYDSNARTVRFYLNGQLDSETHQETAHPARLGPAQIGNWNMHDRKLSGRVDELLILGRVLSDDEVQKLFAAGNPYR